MRLTSKQKRIGIPLIIFVISLPGCVVSLDIPVVGLSLLLFVVCTLSSAASIMFLVMNFAEIYGKQIEIWFNADD